MLMNRQREGSQGRPEKERESEREDRLIEDFLQVPPTRSGHLRAERARERERERERERGREIQRGIKAKTGERLIV